MKLRYVLCGVVFGACVASAAGQPARQGLTNPQVRVEYAAPRSPALRDVYERARKYRVLELLQEFLAPLRLPRELAVQTAECGPQGGAYEPGRPVTICYEAMRDIEANAPGGRIIRIGPNLLSKDGVIMGGFTNLVLNQTAFAVLDMLEIPVWGRMEDAADTVTALVMLEFQKNPLINWATLAGASWFLAQRGFVGVGNFTDVARVPEAQRFYGYACMAAGANPDLFGFLTANRDIPETRANGCRMEYFKHRRAFMQTIMPHVDSAKLRQVRELDWAVRLGLPER
jgi:hypothetical protein